MSSVSYFTKPVNVLTTKSSFSFFSDRECNYSTVSIMGLPQHSGDFSTFRLISPVQETSYSQLLLLPHLVQRKIGMRVASTVFVSSFGAALIQFCPLGFPLSFVRFGFRHVASHVRFVRFFWCFLLSYS